MNPSHPSRATQFVVIGLVACAMLLHEILLTRICALRLQFHFAFLVISNCLLGLGAAGTLLSLNDPTFRRDSGLWLERFCIGNFVALLATYGALIRFPLPDDVQTSNPAHLVALSVFNLVGAIPFLSSGLIVGLLLMMGAEQTNRLYAVDLVAAGVGCLACPMLLPLIGAGGVFATSGLLALTACIVLRWQRSAPMSRVALCILASVAALAVPHVDGWLPVPSKAVPFAPTDYATHSVWTSNSRIDLLTAEGCPWPIYMRGKNNAVPAPRECAQITQDASAATTIINYSEQPQALTLMSTSMYASALRLKEHPSVLIIGLGGGNDVWTAKSQGARSIRAIELNWPIVEIHERTLRRYSRDLVDDPTIEFVVDEGRSAIMRDRAKYDVIQMTGIDTWTALASGAYVLAENYLYTREALASMYAHLKPGGILQISRFSLTTEALRVVSTLDSALRSFGVRNIDHSLIALSTPDNMMTLMIKKGTFTLEEQNRTAEFAQVNGIEVVFLPGQARFGWVDFFARSPVKQQLIDQFPLNIAPVDDDRPYFFNFFKWKNLIFSMGSLETPASVAQGNPVFILAQLLISIVLSVLLIVYPVIRSQGFPRRASRTFLVYFSGLGAGFIAIELAIMQKLTLFLGQPVYSLTVTLFALLIFTGLGSLLLAGRFDHNSRQVMWVPFGIVAYVAMLNFGMSAVMGALAGSQLTARIAVAVSMLAPLGLLLGVPFAYGLRVAERVEPRVVPWAWAVNGCVSVIGSIITVIISMNFGFTTVLWVGSLAYPLAFFALHRGSTSERQSPAAS